MVISCISWTERKKPCSTGRKHRKKALKTRNCSGRSATKNSMNKLLFGAWLLFLLPACAGSRYTHGRIKDVSGEELYTSMQAELVQCETLHGRARVNMDDDGVQSMLADITMQTDSFIGISMRVLGMEVARIYITADSVQIMDRVNKQYLPRSMADFSARFGIPLSLETLQDLLLGRPVWDEGTWYPVVAEDLYRLQATRPGLQNTLDIYPGFLPARQMITDTEQQRTLDLETGGYKKTDGQTFSMNRHIRLDAVDKYAIQLEWASLSLNDPVSFDFQVNPRYEVVH
ncbi:MAG TPA: hypothetical protein DCG22_08295 [Bacteroidetes bacterium]|nr:hypothetical protein [Bacteroidota bacterium]